MSQTCVKRQDGLVYDPKGFDQMAEVGTEPTVAFPRPLAGKVVTIVHPAWHSCGSHQVFVSQARAYRSLGAKVASLALADAPGCVDGSRACRAYFGATSDLEADIRVLAGMPLQKIVNPRFLHAGRQWLHGNFAATWLAAARLAAVPEELTSLPRIDLIHCNHFFCMPAAVRLRERHGCPILLDTHDVQARQYALRNRKGLALPPAVSYDEMLAIELDAMRPADILIHLNGEESAAFEKLLPEKRHALLYPAIGAMPAGAGGGDAIIVASANYPNFLGLRWFLREVLPLAPAVPVQIFGNIDHAFRWRAPWLYQAHRRLFRGRVGPEDLRDAYRDAAAVLLPATAGHGISIKTIEALSCGAPLIATPLAFRGFAIDAAGIPNVVIAEDAAGFAAAMRRAHAQRHLPGFDRKSSATRQLYQQHFAFGAYSKSLKAIVDKALTN
jgi:glycosyltransferase involved in cell wall biosynthesis